MSHRNIAKKIKRSKTMVTNYLSDPSKYGISKHTGKKSKIGIKTKKKIYKLAANKVISSSNIKETLDLNPSRRTVSRILTNELKLKYVKMIGKPPLTPTHKKQI